MYNELNEEIFVSECERFIENNVVAPYVAFYLSKSYILDVLGTATFIQHFNSAVDFFNMDLKNSDKFKNEISKILKEKYHLEILSDNPLKLKEI